MAEIGDTRTGIYHSQIHIHKDCNGEIIYNGTYWCESCGSHINVESHPAVYAGYFKNRYSKGDYEDHPNFDEELYRDGVVEIEAFRGRGQ